MADKVNENDPDFLEDGDDIESLPSKADIKAEKEALKREKKANKEGKGKGGLIAIIIFVLLLGGAIAVLALNLFDIREQYVMPHVRNIPLVGNFFPAEEGDGEVEDTRTPDQLRNLTAAQDIQIMSMENQINNYREQIQAANQRIQALQEIEAQHEEFRQLSAEWNRRIAQGDPIEFADYFHHIAEEHLPQLVDEAIQTNTFNEGVRRQVATLNNMEPELAGAVLERYLQLNPDLLRQWLLLMSPARQAEIFDTFTGTDGTNTVSTFLILVTPQEPVINPLLTPTLPPPPTGAPPAAPPFIPEEDDYEYEEEYDIEDEEEPEVEEEEPTEEEVIEEPDPDPEQDEE